MRDKNMYIFTRKKEIRDNNNNNSLKIDPRRMKEQRGVRLQARVAIDPRSSRCTLADRTIHTLQRIRRR